MKRLSFTDYDVEHLYSLALDNFDENCFECVRLKKRLEKFIGEESVKFQNEKTHIQ